MSMVADNQLDEYEQYDIVWNGIELAVCHKRNWAAGFDHVEVISTGRVPLPITETGYRSAFLHPEQITEYGSAAKYVIAWLDEQSKSNNWIRQELESRQLSLF